ncbi:cation diffusion facilitator family transporter [Algoriphagus machipongonensis]|uniref:Heavy metal efflux pump, CzcD family n=1 Tax=Algoriphagus machipongonensis TaxID=388413 RepID=A3I1M8_9BACT|nr:cation diffusion facilitator family transporter [Algoriphagus machipongonensis]EAZ79694.2 heavy metal efflux pump, CzcD family [Algoriphagus machipongonensis]
MAHHHTPGHHHHHAPNSNLKLAFFMNLSFTILEIIGGIWINSVAIISDAVHDLGDSVSLGLAWYLDKKSKKSANHQFSFGYTRFSLLGALINALILIIGSIFVITEAVTRILNPEVSNAQGMIIFALIGVAVNGYAAWKVSHGSTQNEKVVSWHLIEDVLGWVAVLIAGTILYFVYIPWLDPGLSLAISIFILWNVFKNLKETLYIFLQAVPAELSLEEIKKKICDIDQVESVHHTHLWSLEGAHHVFTTHVRIKKVDNLKEVLDAKTAIKEVLKAYPFSHYTVEVELEEELCELTEPHQH